MPHEAVGERLVPADAPAPAAPSEADGLPGFCPRCRGILTRRRVSSTNRFADSAKADTLAVLKFYTFEPKLFMKPGGR